MRYLGTKYRRPACLVKVLRDMCCRLRCLLQTCHFNLMEISKLLSRLNAKLFAPAGYGLLSQDRQIRPLRQLPARRLHLPPLCRRLPGNLLTSLWSQSLRARGAPPQTAGLRELLRRSRRGRRVFRRLSRRQIDDQLRKLVWVAGAFGVLGHAGILAPLPVRREGSQVGRYSN